MGEVVALMVDCLGWFVRKVEGGIVHQFAVADTQAGRVAIVSASGLCPVQPVQEPNQLDHVIIGRTTALVSEKAQPMLVDRRARSTASKQSRNKRIIGSNYQLI